MRPVTDAQVRKLMQEMSKQGTIGRAALKAAMHRNTARKYLRAGKVPSALRTPRRWRTREDPIAAQDWQELVDRLREASGLEAKALFEDLLERKPERYHAGQLRTFQRRIRRWRASEGPPKEVFFPQEHRPGEALQSDFVSLNELRITIAGEPFAHLVCHSVLPYSNWEDAVVCHSESMLALKRGVQTALFHLGRIPQFHQVDNSTAATHDLRGDSGGQRAFNAEYLRFVAHFGMTPRKIQVRQCHQNGDVESSNGALKRRLEQHLLLRGSRDFESVAAYEAWMGEILVKANRLRHKRIEEEISVMRELCVRRLPDYTTLEVPVTRWSTIRVRENAYSVPSRLIGEQVQVHLYEDRIEVFFRGQLQLQEERLAGRGGHRINYRHIIWWLVQKPGAFARYRYREDLFPSVVFRRAYDALGEALSTSRADLEYLRVLHVAATTMELAVEAALEELLHRGELPSCEAVKARVCPDKPAPPELEAPEVSLLPYDDLLEVGGQVRS